MWIAFYNRESGNVGMHLVCNLVAIISRIKFANFKQLYVFKIASANYAVTYRKVTFFCTTNINYCTTYLITICDHILKTQICIIIIAINFANTSTDCCIRVFLPHKVRKRSKIQAMSTKTEYDNKQNRHILLLYYAICRSCNKHDCSKRNINTISTVKFSCRDNAKH